jgi:two-component system, NtrC family, nitrogen regulation response regulator GlnG
MMVGGRTPIRTNVRIIAATNKDLRQQITQGLFREDLYYRLNVVPLRLPPLRERVQDIPDLVRHFLGRGEISGLPSKTLDPAAMERLKQHRWPGNVRELENLTQRLSVLYADEVITLDIIESELLDSEAMPAEMNAGAEVSLSAAVESNLARYFADHGDELPPPGLYDRILREVERPLITLSLSATQGNQIKAAQLLGLNRNTLRKKIKDLDISVSRSVL